MSASFTIESVNETKSLAELMELGRAGRLFCIPEGIDHDEVAQAINTWLAAKFNQTPSGAGSAEAPDGGTSANAPGSHKVIITPKPISDERIQGSKIESYFLENDPTRAFRCYLNFRLRFKEPVTPAEALGAFCDTFELAPDNVNLVENEAAPDAEGSACFREAVFHVPFEGNDPYTRAEVAALLSTQLGIPVQPGQIELEA